MKKLFIIDFLGVIVAKIVSLFLCCMPLGLSLWIGRRLGGIAYLLNTKRRSIAYANLKSAFPEKGICELKRINKKHFENLGMTIVELMKFPVMGKGYVDRYTSIEHSERIKEALEKQKGAILLAAHFGNWELGSLVVNKKGYNMSVFVREQKYTRMDNLLNRYREMASSKVITKGFSVRDIIKELHSNGLVAMLIDQDAGSSGVFVDFFGRPASVAQGALAFSLKTSAAIIPSFTWRIGHKRHNVEMGEPLKFINTQDTKENLKKMTGIVEGYIRRFPEQWLWSHKRWKSTPKRAVLVLSDGKPGHLNQAMAVAEMVKDALSLRLKARGIEEDPVLDIQVREVKFKNRLMRPLLDICSLFAGLRCQGCLQCLKICLKKESFDKIKNTYADIVISCGASMVGTNTFLKYENNAKGVVIMKPGLGRARRFNLVVLPRHDASQNSRTNTLITESAPNRITEEAMKKATSLAARQLTINQSPITNNQQGIGLLIGGDAKGFRLKKKSVEMLVDGVLKIAGDMDLNLFVSTSRRTPPEIDTLLKNRLGKNPRCRLLVIANEKNIDGIVPAIFGLSEVVIVSPESVSMISEGASSGKHVVVFKDKKIAPRKNKYERTIKNLETKGYITSEAPEDIYNSLKRILKEKPPVKKLEDRKKIIEGLKSIL